MMSFMVASSLEPAADRLGQRGKQIAFVVRFIFLPVEWRTRGMQLVMIVHCLLYVSLVFSGP